MEQSPMQLYRKQLLKAGIRLEGKEQLDLEEWLLPDDVSPFSRKRPAGGVISLPKKRTRITLTPNAEISPQRQTLGRSDPQIPSKNKRDRDRDRDGNPDRRPETQTQTVTITVLQPESMPGKETISRRLTDSQTFSPQTLEPDTLIHPQIPNKDKRDRDKDRNPERKLETRTIHTDRQIPFGFVPKVMFVVPIDETTHMRHNVNPFQMWVSSERILGAENCHWIRIADDVPEFEQECIMIHQGRRELKQRKL